MNAFLEHMQSGSTTVCRCWAVTRKDGETFGFTDHDLPLAFEGLEFAAETGLTARALVTGTGLSVNNSEAMGALSSASITEADIDAGRYDEAEVRMWLVNWADPEQRSLRFRGHIGELRRRGGAFHAELRGLTEGLNRPQGLVYQKPCAAVLGDGRCAIDLSDPVYSVQATLTSVEDGRVFLFARLNSYEPAWFERGVLRVLGGVGDGQNGSVKRDLVLENGDRKVELWQALRGDIGSGDTVELTAGCDKRMETCQYKFNNINNYRGFPHLPGEDWLMRVPKQADDNSGGKMDR